MQGRVFVASVGQQPNTLAPAAKPRHAAYPAQRVRCSMFMRASDVYWCSNCTHAVNICAEAYMSLHRSQGDNGLHWQAQPRSVCSPG